MYTETAARCDVQGYVLTFSDEPNQPCTKNSNMRIEATNITEHTWSKPYHKIRKPTHVASNLTAPFGTQVHWYRVT